MKNQNTRFKNLVRGLLPAAAFLGMAISAQANDKKDIVDTAAAAGGFHTLIDAVKAAGLTHALKENGPLTVFAPTDKAFAKLPKHTLQDLLKPENKHKLAQILKYHVVSGKVTSTDAVRAGSAKTLAGEAVRISIEGGQLSINNAKVVANDLEARNGIIHVIDTVLLPPEKETLPKPGSDITVLQRIDPSAESELESETTHEPVSLTFCNLSSKPMQVYWIDFLGNRKQWRGKIEPGATETCERTYATHVWLIADEHGKGLGLYVAGGKDGIIVNTRS